MPVTWNAIKFSWSTTRKWNKSVFVIAGSESELLFIVSLTLLPLNGYPANVRIKIDVLQMTLVQHITNACSPLAIAIQVEQQHSLVTEKTYSQATVCIVMISRLWPIFVEIHLCLYVTSTTVPVLTFTRPVINADSCCRLHFLTWRVLGVITSLSSVCTNHRASWQAQRPGDSRWLDIRMLSPSLLVAPQDYFLKLVSSFISQTFHHMLLMYSDPETRTTPLIWKQHSSSPSPLPITPGSSTRTNDSDCNCVPCEGAPLCYLWFDFNLNQKVWSQTGQELA